MFERYNHDYNNWYTGDPLANEYVHHRDTRLCTSSTSDGEALYHVIQGGRYDLGKDMICAKLSPKTIDKFLNQLTPGLKDLVFDCWHSSRDIRQLYDGQVLLPMKTDEDCQNVHKRYFYTTIQELIDIANLQYDEVNRCYTVHTKMENMFFTESEIAFAINQTDIYDGITGVCRKLALLNYLHSVPLFKNMPHTISMIFTMHNSRIVDGAMSYYERILQAIDNRDLAHSRGIESEVRAAFDVFERVRYSNLYVPRPHRSFLHISRDIPHSEVDVTVFRLNKNNFRVPIEMIETKTRLQTFMKSIRMYKGRNQMFNYFCECLKHPISPRTACPLKIYFLNDKIRQDANFFDNYQYNRRRNRFEHYSYQVPRKGVRRIKSVRNNLLDAFVAAKKNKFGNMAINVQLLSLNDSENYSETMDAFTLF